MFEPIDFDIYEKSFEWHISNLEKNLEAWESQEKEIKLFSGIITSSIPGVGSHKVVVALGRSFNIGAWPYFNHAYYGLGMNCGNSVVLTYDRDETPKVSENDVRIAFSVSGTTDETWYDMEKASNGGAILCCVTADLYPDNLKRSIPNLCRESWKKWVSKTGYKWDGETYPIIKVIGKREDVAENSYAKRQISGRVVPLTPLGTAGEIAEFSFGRCLAAAQAEQLKYGRDEIDFGTFIKFGQSDLDQLNEAKKYLFSNEDLVCETFDTINNTQALLGRAGGLSLSILKSFIMRLNHLKNDGRIREDLHKDYRFRLASVIDNSAFSFESLRGKIKDGTYLGLTLSNNELNPESRTTIDFARKAKESGYKVIAITAYPGDGVPDSGILNYSNISIKLPNKNYPLLVSGYELRNDLASMLTLESGVPALLESRGLSEEDMLSSHK